MSLTVENKKSVVEKFAQGKGDTGSPQVQIALLTERLKSLNGHFQKNKNDHHSRLGLLRMVGRRRRLLRYLWNNDPQGYDKLVSDLNIRG
jgi:small subunit ribosomal protein S15